MKAAYVGERHEDLSDLNEYSVDFDFYDSLEEFDENKNSFDAVVFDYEFLPDDFDYSNIDEPLLVVFDEFLEEEVEDLYDSGLNDYLTGNGSVGFSEIALKTENLVENYRHRDSCRRERERLDNFSSTVSHDLRNPLNVAEGHNEIVKNYLEREVKEQLGEDEIPEIVLDSLEKVEGSLDRMEEIIDDALAYARFGRTIEDEELQEVNIVELADNCWENINSEDAEIEFTENEIIMDADPSRVKRLFENLYRNSIEHGGEDVKVEVGPIDPMFTSTRSDEKEEIYGFYVEDDGPGVPEEHQEDIFEQGVTHNHGTGLGLPIAEAIAEAHGWSIEYKDSLKGGARFEITH